MIAGWEEDPKICESMIELSKELKKYVSWINKEEMKILVENYFKNTKKIIE